MLCKKSSFGFKKACAATVLCLAVLVTSACGNNTDETKTAKGTGYVSDSYACVLDDLVLMPEYDTETQKGYAVIFLQKEAEAPILPFATTENFDKSSARIDLTLTQKGVLIPSKDILFAPTTDNKKFKGRVTIVFQIDKDKSFPRYGTFVINESKDAESTSLKTYDIDFLDMEPVAQ